MKRWMTVAVLLLAGGAARSARAQTTVVTGTITDANGVPYSGATVRAQLVGAGGVIPQSPFITLQTTPACQAAGFSAAPCNVPISSTAGPVTAGGPTVVGSTYGAFTITLYDNTYTGPGVLQWKFIVQEPGSPPVLGTGAQAFTTTITISGASQSVSSQISAAAPALTTFTFSTGGGAPTGPAGGDLGSSYPNPTVLNLSHAVTIPTWNQNTSGNAATATALASYTHYSVYISNGAGGTWATPTGNSQCLLSDPSSYATAIPLFGACPSGGPGTGTSNCLSYWASTSTLGSICGNVTGQVWVSVNGSHPIAASPGLPDGNGGSPVTSSGYTIQCDNGSTTLDRTTFIRFQSGASAPVVPLSSASGCPYLSVVLADDGAGSLVFGRTGSDTFSVFNGSTASDSQTSFTLTNGQYASLSQGATGIWEVRITTGGSGSGTVTSFSSGGLSPLFTTSVATSTTTPALSFSLSTAAADTLFGNNTGSTAAPGYTSAPVVATLQATGNIAAGGASLTNCGGGTGGAVCYGSGTPPTTNLTSQYGIAADSTNTCNDLFVNGTNTGCIKSVLFGTTSSLGGSLLTAGSCTSGTVSITGATTSMVATASPVTYPGDGNYWLAYVSASNTVTVKVCAVLSLTPTASAYNVRVQP